MCCINNASLNIANRFPADVIIICQLIRANELCNRRATLIINTLTLTITVHGIWVFRAFNKYLLKTKQIPAARLILYKRGSSRAFNHCAYCRPSILMSSVVNWWWGWIVQVVKRLNQFCTRALWDVYARKVNSIGSNWCKMLERMIIVGECECVCVSVCLPSTLVLSSSCYTPCTN